MKQYVALGLALVLTMASCNVPWVVQYPTPQVIVVTASAEPTIAPTRTPTIVTPTPTATLVPTETPAPPIFTTSGYANCRQGPSTNYQVLLVLPTGSAVPIKSQIVWHDNLWLLVDVPEGGGVGIECWISEITGSISGDFRNVPPYPPYLLPPEPLSKPAPEMVKVTFENATGSQICGLDLYIGVTVIKSFDWQKKEFKDGEKKTLIVPIGHYDLVEAYNCKAPPKLTGTLTDVVMDSINNHFSLELP